MGLLVILFKAQTIMGRLIPRTKSKSAFPQSVFTQNTDMERSTSSTSQLIQQVIHLAWPVLVAQLAMMLMP